MTEIAGEILSRRRSDAAGVDLAKSDSIEDFCAQAVRAVGAVEILVSNAGRPHPVGHRAPKPRTSRHRRGQPAGRATMTRLVGATDGGALSR